MANQIVAVIHLAHVLSLLGESAQRDHARRRGNHVRISWDRRGGKVVGIRSSRPRLNHSSPPDVPT
jgi:hypothetical protein